MTHVLLCLYLASYATPLLCTTDGDAAAIKAYMHTEGGLATAERLLKTSQRPRRQWAAVPHGTGGSGPSGFDLYDC